MKSFILLLIGVFCIPHITYAECKTPEIGYSFILEKQGLFSGVQLAKHNIFESDDTTFGDVYALEYDHGVINLIFDGLSYEYDMKAVGVNVGEGKLFEVFDCEQKKIGIIREVLEIGLLSTTAKYIIEDTEGNIIAISDRVASNATSINLLTIEGYPIVEMLRSRFTLTKAWNFSIMNHDVDPRFYMLIAIYRNFK